MSAPMTVEGVMCKHTSIQAEDTSCYGQTGIVVHAKKDKEKKTPRKSAVAARTSTRAGFFEGTERWPPVGVTYVVPNVANRALIRNGFPL
jgi:hypothetical protein